VKKSFIGPLTPDDVARIANVIRKGWIGVFPTDTVYGIGCRGDDARSTASLFRIKGRRLDRTLPLLIGDWVQFDRFAGAVGRKHRARLEKLWPGALTAVVRGGEQVNSLSFHCQKEGTVALRMPAHPTLRLIVSQVGVPLAATSANPSGGREALNLSMVSPAIREQADWLWSEEIKMNGALPSTIVDITGTKPEVLRRGTVEF